MTKLLDIFNPLHNVKEVCKEFVLLEDHLAAPGKHCPDCIRKHLLKAEAFSEEAIALDKEGKWKDRLSPLPQQIRDLGDEYCEDTCDKHMLGQKVRMIRKSLSPLCYPKKNKRNLSKKVFKSQAPANDSISWDFWSGVAAGLGVPSEQIPLFSKALKSLQDSDLEPYFDLSAPNVSLRVKSNTEWVQKRLVHLLNSSITKKMIMRSINNGKRYTFKDWKIGIASALGKTNKSIRFETPSSSLGEYVDNRRVMKRAYQEALSKSLYGLIKKARRLEKSSHPRHKLISATLFEKIGDTSSIPYFWAKAAQLYSHQDKSAEETRSLAKIVKYYPDHELKFWIANRVVIFDKTSNKILRTMMPDHEPLHSKSRFKESLKVVGPIALGFAIGLL
jgi:hypothetical protein